MSVHVIGIGTRQGDDAAGLAVAERLAADGLPPRVRVTTCERPGPELVEELDGASGVVLVDALASDGSPGAVRRPIPSRLARGRSLSSHAWSAADVLAFAEALDRAPRRGEIVAIERGPAREGGLSAPVRRGVERAARLVRDLALELAAEAGDAKGGPPCTKPGSASP